jgi:hypothetical protein
MKWLVRFVPLWMLGAAFAISASGCDSRGTCAIVRTYGVRATVRGGASEGPGAGGQPGLGEGGVGQAGASQAGVGQAGASLGGSGQGGAGEAQICLARVLAVSDEYSEELKCNALGADCDCFGLSELPGTYEITATLGSRHETQEVTVRPSGCNVTTEELTFFEE